MTQQQYTAILQQIDYIIKQNLSTSRIMKHKIIAAKPERFSLFGGPVYLYVR